MKNKENLTCCPHCGSKSGFLSRSTAIQYYKADGSPNGLEVDDKKAILVTCIKCGRRVKITRLENGTL